MHALLVNPPRAFHLAQPNDNRKLLQPCGRPGPERYCPKHISITYHSQLEQCMARYPIPMMSAHFFFQNNPPTTTVLYEHLIALQKLPGELASWERSSHLLDLLLNRLQDLSSAEEASQICQKQAGTRPPFWKKRPAYSMQESGKKTERTITHAVMEKSYSQVECLICKSCCFKTTFWEVTTSKCTPSNNHLW